MVSSKKIDKAIVKIFIPDFINQLRRKGIITKEDLKSEAALKKLNQYLKDNPGETELEVIPDHRNTLLIIAEDAFKGNHFELSLSMYATFIEHTLNRIIHLSVQTKKLDHKTKIEIIRSVNITGKCTWLLKLLELPNINSEHIRTINLIADQRNSYIHYKWKSDFQPKRDDEKDYYAALQTKAKRLVRYLKTYESKIEYQGLKKAVKVAASH